MAGVRSLSMPLVRNLRLLAQSSSIRCLSAKPPPEEPVCDFECDPGPATKEIPGLSNKVFCIPSEPVGPGAAKDKPYKNPEYFSYNNTSYFEAEVEMAKYRLPQPSNKTPLK